jgi:hypothetical protein
MILTRCGENAKNILIARLNKEILPETPTDQNVADSASFGLTPQPTVPKPFGVESEMSCLLQLYSVRPNTFVVSFVNSFNKAVRIACYFLLFCLHCFCSLR